MLINEVVDVLYFRVVSGVDIDLVMIKGVNYFKGLFIWVDEIGIEICV